eukprot:scaffold647850_cov46-Prasinocladus_malaysianus.AAC.6
MILRGTRVRAGTRTSMAGTERELAAVATVVANTSQQHQFRFSRRLAESPSRHSERHNVEVTVWGYLEIVVDEAADSLRVNV